MNKKDLTYWDKLLKNLNFTSYLDIWDCLDWKTKFEILEIGNYYRKNEKNK